MANQTLVIFDAKPASTMISAAHPTEAKNKDYQMPRAGEDSRAALLPIGTMAQNDDGSWTIHLSSRPSSDVLVAKPLG